MPHWELDLNAASIFSRSLKNNGKKGQGVAFHTMMSDSLNQYIILESSTLLKSVGNLKGF